MTDPIPINLASLEQRASQKIASQEIAFQIASKDSFIEDTERGGINPAVIARQAQRRERFRPLEGRRQQAEPSERKIAEVEKKSEEDLAQSYHRRNPELPPNRLRVLRDRLRASQSAEELLSAVNEEFADPTLADEALEYLEKELSGELKEHVRAARTLLNELKSREIIAGRNIDSVAKSFHKKGIGETPSSLRDLYRDITGNPREHNLLFSELSARYSFDQLKLVVAFLLKGMAFDLKSKGPSIQQAELIRLMTEVRNLQSILWVYLFFKSRMRLIRSLYDYYDLELPTHLSFEQLAKEFILLVEERYPSILKLLKQLEKLHVIDEGAKIIILMQYRDAIRNLSPRIYKSPRHKQDLLLLILESLQELEEATEEAEAAL